MRSHYFLAFVLCIAGCVYVGPIFGQDDLGQIRNKAEKGDAAAAFQLANHYFFGTGVQQSTSQAVRWLRAAADSGNVAGQALLGRLYAGGVGVTTDYVEAAHWSNLAAQNGDKQAQFDIGSLYESGLGVRKNVATAAYWYEKSAKQGDGLSATHLKQLTDIGVEPRSPDQTQLPPANSAYTLSSLESAARNEDLHRGTAASAHDIVAQSPHKSLASNLRCNKSIAFAIVFNGRVTAGVPDFAERWVNKNGRNYPEICFSQIPIQGLRNLIFVFSSSQNVLSGLQPVVRTTSSTSTSPVSGSGTITSTEGEMWQYTYNGTVTTTTTTTNTQDVPYSLRENTLYLTVYDSTGAMVQQRWATDSRQIGGDPYQALGHNLGMALANIHIRDRLLKGAVKEIERR